MNSIVLYLIRHGKTFCNEKRLYCGSSDINLSDKGIEELKEKKKTINYPICKLNYTSGAKRANETFEIIYGNSNYVIKDEFFEYDFGDFELKSYEDLKEDSRYIDWIMDKSLNVACPNGESKMQFRKRIKEGLIKLIKEIKEKKENEALVLCHGGTIGTLLEVFLKEKDFYSYQPSCGGGYKLKISYTEDLEENIKIEILEEL